MRTKQPTIDELAHAILYNGIFVDTNLLVLYFANIGTNATQNFTKENFLAIKKTIETANKVYVTPHILTEVSNILIDHQSGMKYGSSAEKILNFLKEKHNLTEKEIGFNLIIEDELFFRQHGMADKSVDLVANAENGILVITDDEGLMCMLTSKATKVLMIDELTTIYANIN